MAQQKKDQSASTAEAGVQRVRKLNDGIVDSARRGGEASLDAYEQLLKSIADYQQSTGKRGADFVTAVTEAQADFTRRVAEAGPSAARKAGSAVGDVAGNAARQTRRVPGVAEAEGEIRGAGAAQSDLPIRGYDSLNADEVIRRLSRLSKVNLGKVDAYERKHQNRKTVRDKIASVRGEHS